MTKKPADFFKLIASDFKPMTPAEVFSCRFKERSGWAILFLHEETGTVAIHSDYGDWTYSWSKSGLGSRTLKEFLCYSGSGCYDYLADKFEQGHREIFDRDQTILDIKDAIAEACDKQPVTYDEDLCQELDIWLDEKCPHTPELIMERMPEELQAILGDEPRSIFVYDRRPAFYWLRDGILPALITEVRKTLPQQVSI